MGQQQQIQQQAQAEAFGSSGSFAADMARRIADNPIMAYNRSNPAQTVDIDNWDLMPNQYQGEASTVSMTGWEMLSSGWVPEELAGRRDLYFHDQPSAAGNASQYDPVLGRSSRGANNPNYLGNNTFGDAPFPEDIVPDNEGRQREIDARIAQNPAIRKALVEKDERDTMRGIYLDQLDQEQRAREEKQRAEQTGLAGVNNAAKDILASIPRLPRTMYELGSGLYNGNISLLDVGEKLVVDPFVQIYQGIDEKNSYKFAMGMVGLSAFKPGSILAKERELAAVGANTVFASTETVSVSGRRAIDLGKVYEAGVRDLYGNVPFGQRQYEALVNGTWVNGIADNVVQIGGKNTAIEAKFVEDWATSLRNPASPNGAKPWALIEQQKMLDQAAKYNAAFDQVIYHTNSIDLATHYSNAFKNAGITNFKFMITPTK
jgi:hypothetical protein